MLCGKVGVGNVFSVFCVDFDSRSLLLYFLWLGKVGAMKMIELDTKDRTVVKDAMGIKETST